MEKLLEAMQKDMELAKVVFGEDKKAAYEAANAVAPCDKVQFEAFYNEQRAKSSEIAKVFQRAATDDEFAKIIYGEDRKAAYEAAQKVASGYTAEEFENVCKMLVSAALKIKNKDDELLSDEDLDQVAGGSKGWGLAAFIGGLVGTGGGIVGACCLGVALSNPITATVAVIGCGAVMVGGIVSMVEGEKELNDIKRRKELRDSE